MVSTLLMLCYGTPCGNQLKQDGFYIANVSNHLKQDVAYIGNVSNQ